MNAQTVYQWKGCAVCTATNSTVIYMDTSIKVFHALVLCMLLHAGLPLISQADTHHQDFYLAACRKKSEHMFGIRLAGTWIGPRMIIDSPLHATGDQKTF